MALDGVVLANIGHELKRILLGGRVDKIYQPEADEIIFSVRSIGKNYKLLLTANPSHPRLHLTEKQKENPMAPPMFCMVLRKHLSGGKLISIEQPNFERILILSVESTNEMGDLTTKQLVIEIMGKHSNIILLDESNRILDSIKHISRDKSSVREVLPGREYIFPPAQNKLNPLFLTAQTFMEKLEESTGVHIQKALYQSYSGVSPVTASEICYRAMLDPSTYMEQLTKEHKEKLFESFFHLMQDVSDGRFQPQIIRDPSSEKIIEFGSIDMGLFHDFSKAPFDSISQLLEFYYFERDKMSRIQQKSHDLKKLIQSNLDRCIKKKDLQLQTIRDTEKKDLWKIWGELITANIYLLEKGMTEFTTQNYYEDTLPMVTISLDPTLTPSENAQRYFQKYNKAKRTLAALKDQMIQNEQEIQYLESLMNGIESSTEESDIKEIHQELMEEGYVRKRKIGKGEKIKKSKPLHYQSSDGFDIYVGKNNTQNDELTLRFAGPYDLWFHTKEIPGSHVIVKTNHIEVPEQTLLEAAQLAGFYSKARDSSSVPIDYTIRKHVKKPNGAKPGMVIYEQNKTIYVTPEESFIHRLQML